MSEALVSTSKKTLEVLQRAFESDPAAMHALMCNRVPCNETLRKDEHVIVEQSPVLDADQCHVGALGLINGVLAANGLPLVAMKFDCRGPGVANKLVGFCEYKRVTDSTA